MPPPEPRGLPDFSRRVVTRRGEVVEFDTPEQAAEALARTDASGRALFSADTAEARERRRLRREYGDRPIAAGSAAAASEATLGVSDVAGDALGYGEDLARLREFNPEASVAGSVVGGVAPILAFGPLGAAGEAVEGASLLARGARAITAPTRAVAGLSEALGGVAGTALRGSGSSLLRRAAGTIGGLAVEGAVEGAGGEIGRMVSEAALEDTEFTAESILGRLRSGTLLGAATGGLLGAGGSLLREIGGGAASVARGSSDLVRRAWTARMGTELPEDVANTWALVSGRRGGDIRDSLSMTEEGRRIRALIDEGDGVYDRGTLAIRDSLNSLERARLHATDFWRRGLKRDQIAPIVSTERAADQLAEAAGVLDGLRSYTSRIRNDPGAYSTAARRNANRLDEVVASVERRITDTAGRDARAVSADLFTELDTIKRELGEVQRRLSGADGTRGGLEVEEARNLYEGLRQTLERSDLWGEAADVQRAVNLAYTGDLTTRNAFARRFLAGDAARDDVDPFRRIAQGDSAQVDAFLRRAGTVANDTAEGTFRESLDATDRLLRVMDEHLDLPPDVRAEIVDGLRGAARARTTFDEAVADARRMNTWRAVSGPGAGFERTVAGTAFGAMAGGPLGALAAAAATNPAIAVRALGMLERITQNTAGQIGDSVRGFLTSARSGAREAGRRTRRALVSGAEAYRARVGQLDEDTRNPRGASERLARSLEGLDAAPTVRDSVAAGVARANGYLAQHRPGARAIAGQLRPRTDALPSAGEMHAFLRRARVVDDPMSVLDDVRDGRISGEAVDALRTVYPRLYQQITQAVVRELAASGAEPSYQQRIALAVLLGVPTDPSLTPSHMRITAQAFAVLNEYAQAAASQPAPNFAAGVASGAEALERRRAA